MVFWGPDASNVLSLSCHNKLALVLLVVVPFFFVSFYTQHYARTTIIGGGVCEEDGCPPVCPTNNKITIRRRRTVKNDWRVMRLLGEGEELF